MIQSRFLVPNYLTENSKDVHTFLRLIDLMVNNAKSKTDDFVNILNPDKCPNQLLPLLASYVGYKYDYNETYDSNRTIIRSYKDMIRNKGNTNGIQLATSIAISMEANKSLIDAQELIRVTFYDYYYRCSKCGYIAYEPFEECPHCESTDTAQKIDSDTIVIVVEYPLYSAKMYDLVEAVRPVGVNCLMYNGTIVNTEETLGLTDFIKLQSKFLNDGMSEVGGIDAVSGFTTILKEKPTEKYCETCGTHISMYEKVKEYQGSVDYYKYNYLNGYYSKITINDETEFNEIIETTVLYIKSTTDICPKCGSELTTEDDSSLRLLYRLYTDYPNYNASVKSILENIIPNENNSDGNIKNNSDCVGVILRINIDSDAEVNYEYDNGTKNEEIDWGCNFTQSFIFGLKPYINIPVGNNENKELRYLVTDIFKKLAKSNDKYNLQTMKNYDDTQFSSYNFVCGLPASADKGNDAYDNTTFDTDNGRDYRISSKITSSETGNEYYYKYSLKDIAGKLYKISDTSFKQVDNSAEYDSNTKYYRTVTDYNEIESYTSNIQSYYYLDDDEYILDTSIIDENTFDESQQEHTNIYVMVYYTNKYYVDTKINSDNFEENKPYLYVENVLDLIGTIERTENKTEIEDEDDYDSNANYYYYNDYNVLLLDTKIVDESTFNSERKKQKEANKHLYTLGETTYTDSETSENAIFDFKLGEDTQKLEPNDYHFDGLIVTDESETLTDNKGKYIYVCRACNNVIGVTDKNIDVCPICGGIITTDASKSSSQQFYDHTILQGSYLLDLYFGN